MYGDNCRYRHNNETCVDKNCNVFKCEKRHPRICNFFTEFGQCKFTTYCRYKHEKKIDVFENFEKINELEKKIVNLEKTTKRTEDKSEGQKIEKTLEAFEKNMEEKITTFEIKIKQFNDVIEKKDKSISKLEKQLEEIQNKFTEFTNNDDKLKKKKKKKTFECDHCDFSASSEKGLRIHITRIHSISNYISEQQFPKTCDLCDYEADNKKDLKQHLKTHSYKGVNFQCRECEYFCETEPEMEVHLGKKHSDQFNCGICEFEAKSFENLKIHLTTCEMYRCERCDSKLTTLKDMKEHIETEHLEIKGYINVVHMKQSRSDCEIIDERSHRAEGLFPEFLKK